MSRNRAIKEYLATKVKRNADGEMLCTRCGKVVPSSHRLVYFDEDTPDHIWGPCCSDECICYTKICSGCNEAFFYNKKSEDGSFEIDYYQDGKWFCKKCAASLEACPVCGEKRKLVDGPNNTKICPDCFNRYYFKCNTCNKILDKNLSANEQFTKNKLVAYSHEIPDAACICAGCYTNKIQHITPQKVKACKCCGEVFTYKQGEEEEEYCENCFRRGLVIVCNGCGLKTHHFISSNNKFYCSKCAVTLCNCEHCGKKDIKRKMVKRKLPHNQMAYVCKECSKIDLEVCKVCFSVHAKGSSCKSCDLKLNVCGKCGKPHFQEPFCRDNNTPAHIMNYSYKPHTYFNYISDNPSCFIGFENEINYNTQSISGKQLINIYKNYKASEVYIKSDASIHNFGFEVVSHPMDESYFNYINLEPMFLYKPKDEDTSCGLHVHVSKKSFEGESHLYKFIYFINNNKDFIKNIAGRSYTGYCKQINDKLTEVITKKLIPDRYSAVNVNPENTVEVRVFNGAKTEYQLRYRVEFVFAVVEFTRSASLKDFTVDTFMKWLLNTKGYTNLKKFLIKGGK